MDSNSRLKYTSVTVLIKEVTSGILIKQSLFLLVLIFATSVKGQDLVIVQSNLPKSVIVISDSPSAQIRIAAKFLQENIQKSTGATLPITSNYSENINSIHIGNTSYVQRLKIYTRHLDEDGFIYHNSDAKKFIILGGSDWGTEFGIYSFLERFLNIQFLMPTEIGTVIPLVSNLVLPKLSIYENPIFISRQISPIYIYQNNVLGQWGLLNRLRGRIMFSHNLLNLYSPSEFSKTNPDFFMGADTSSENWWQPNFSAKGIVDTGAAKIIRFFRSKPGESSYSLGINDSPYFDQSEASLKRRKGRKNYLGMEDVSDDYFKWANEVVQKVTRVFPDKLFGLLAYSNVADPPSPDVGVHPSIIPFITYERLRWADSSLEIKGHQLNNAWEKEARNVGWYDYTYGLNYLAPRVWFNEMQDYLQWGAKNNVKYYYAELYPNWGEGPKPWIQAKLLWNPNYNLDSLLNVWYVSFAGEKAAPKLKEFYSIWEVFWTKDIFSSKWDTINGQYLPFNDYSYLDAIPKSYINNTDKLINDAFALAASDLQKKRIKKLVEMWQLYKTAITLWQQSSLPTNQKNNSLISSAQFISLLNNLENDPLHSLSIQRIKMTLEIK